MRVKLLTFLLLYLSNLFIVDIKAQGNQNIDNLLNATQWNALFPKRAGTLSGHPQGYVADFYSFLNFKEAVDEMADYLVVIRKKQGVWGELITITRKSTNTSYIYSDVDSLWYTNSTPETIINVDFEDFANTASAVNNKRELAAFLANISKETTGGWQLPVGGGSAGDYAQWGLYFVHEVGYNSTNGVGTYSQASTDYPPNSTKGYYGRGPIQLSWNYNYGQFSKFLYNDINVLLNNPDLIQEDGALAFKSAIWFWMMPQCPKPSCHQAMHNLLAPQSGVYTSSKMYKKGFAHTNNIINGGLECRNTSSAAFTQKVVLRSEIYKYYLAILGFNTAEIASEDSGDYSTLCYESTSNAMQDYLSCSVSVLNNVSFALDALKVYPNPVSSQLRIDYSEKVDAIEVYDIVEKKYLSLQPIDLTNTLDFSRFNAGTYFVKIILRNNSITYKVIKN